jgi:hypothetical protein
MKKIFFLIAMLASVSTIFAQDDYQNDEIKTLFSKNRSNGGYGAFTISYSNIGGQDALVTGGRGAFIFSHSLALGLGGYGFVNNLDYDSYHLENDLSLTGGYGGLLIEPIIAGKSPVHLSFPILIGGGGVTLVDLYNWDNWGNPYPVYEYDYDSFFVIEPSAELEVNVARFFRLAAAVSYRHTSEIQLHQISSDALRGFNYGLTFKFGKF